MSDTTAPKTRTRSRSPLVGLPTFRAPEPESPPESPQEHPQVPQHPLLREVQPDTLPQPHPSLTLRADDASSGSTPTGLWGTRTPSAAETKTTVKMVAGVSKLLMVLGDALLGRAGRQLRRPTPEQLDEFATPIGAIVARHFDVSKLGQDVADLTTAGGAFGDWLSDGPVTLPKGPNVVQVGMPEPDPFSTPLPPEDNPIPGQTEIDLTPTGPIQYL